MSAPTASAQGAVGRAAAVFDLSRGRQALLSVAQPALGALLALGALPSVRVVALGLVAAGSGFLAVFSLNDLLDRKVDIEAAESGPVGGDGYDLDTAYVRHPLARGDLSVREASVWIGGLAAVSIVCAWLLAPICLALFAGAVALEVFYCTLRRVTWAKTFVSGLMVGVGGLAGWVAVARLSWGAAAFFAFLALWEIGGRNLPNDLADLDADGRTGIRTVATTFGPAVSATATLAVTWATLASVLLLPTSLLARLGAAVAAVAVMVVPALGLARQPTSERAGRYFNLASTLPVVVFFIVLVATLAL